MDAIRDQNRVPVALGVSTADSTITTPFTVNPVTGGLQVSSVAVSSGTTAPATTPASVGLFFVDTVGKKLYFSTGTASSADWTIAN